MRRPSPPRRCSPAATASVLQVGATAAASVRCRRTRRGGRGLTPAQTGFVGSGVSGAYLQAALTDVDYIRRITLNVGRIASISGGALTLESPLLAGAPTSAMKVSAVTGFCDREGSSFFQEWSALFVGAGQQGERILWHYPRLQARAASRRPSRPLSAATRRCASAPPSVRCPSRTPWTARPSFASAATSQP